MLRERAEPKPADPAELAATADAGERATTKFTSAGSIPPVAVHDAAPNARPSASELAYPPHTAAPEPAAADATKEPFLTGDIMYEQLAHRFAYRDSLSAEDRAWLKNQGMEAKG